MNWGGYTGWISPNALLSQSTQRNSTTRRNAGSGRDQISKRKNAKCVVNPWRLCHVAWRPSLLISSDQLALLGIHSQKNQAWSAKRVTWIRRDMYSKSALSERPLIRAMSAAVLSMNQSPLRPRNVDGRENNAYRTWSSSSGTICLSPDSQRWYTNGGMIETKASRCWLWLSCHTTKKNPPVPWPGLSNATSEAARERGPACGQISICLENLIAMMIRNKSKHRRNSAVNSKMRYCCLRLIETRPPQPMRPHTPSTEKLTTP